MLRRSWICARRTSIMSKDTAGPGRPSEPEEATAVGTQTPIDPSKLADFLTAMAPKWFEIALKLGCKDTAMSLRSSNELDQRKCFVVIDEWMNKEENACWEVLCRDVLRSEGGGLGQVADRIEQVIT